MLVKKPTIAVFGDAFRDIYWIGTTTRISPEAPIPVVVVSDSEWMEGGAANVQRNLISLGAFTWAPTCYFDTKNHKNRLICNNQQVARWDENDVCLEITKTQVNKVSSLQPNAVIVSDYGKGAITYETIEAIAALNLPTFIDTKRNPRDFDVIQDPTFFPNQKEYTEYLQDYRVQPSVVLKKSELGIQKLKFGKIVEEYPAWAKKVVSVCGAGDTVIAAYTYAAVTQRSSLIFANAAAAVVVEKPWTATASFDEIQEKLWEASFVIAGRS